MADNTTSGSRNRILKRLRAAPHSKTFQEGCEPWQPISGRPVSEKIRTFCDALTLSHAQVIACRRGNLSDKLAEVIQSKRLSQWVCSNTPELSRLLEQTAADSGQTVQIQRFEILSRSEEKRALFNDVQASLTQAHSGIAGTGTLVLLPGLNEPRSLSLVPPVHVVMVSASRLFDHFGQWLSAHPEVTQAMPTNLLLVSGPSKTADIQQTLAYGAHGPKELIVLVIEDE